MLALASCVRPMIERGTQNSVQITSDGLLEFAASELYASLRWARIRMDITRELV